MFANKVGLGLIGALLQVPVVITVGVFTAIANCVAHIVVNAPYKNILIMGVLLALLVALSFHLITPYIEVVMLNILQQGVLYDILYGSLILFSFVVFCCFVLILGIKRALICALFIVFVFFLFSFRLRTAL